MRIRLNLMVYPFAVDKIQFRWYTSSNTSCYCQCTEQTIKNPCYIYINFMSIVIEAFLCTHILQNRHCVPLSLCIQYTDTHRLLCVPFVFTIFAGYISFKIQLTWQYYLTNNKLVQWNFWVLVPLSVCSFFAYYASIECLNVL